MLGPYKARIDEPLAENETLPRKQQYTGTRICAILEDAGYMGSRSGVRAYLVEQRKAQRRPQVYLPLEFDPGTDAQVDWGGRGRRDRRRTGEGAAVLHAPELLAVHIHDGLSHAAPRSVPDGARACL